MSRRVLEGGAQWLLWDPSFLSVAPWCEKGELRRGFGAAFPSLPVLVVRPLVAFVALLCSVVPFLGEMVCFECV